MSAPAARPRPRLIDEITAATALIAVTTVTAVSMARVFVGWDFLRPLLIVAIAVHLTCWVGRRCRLPIVIALPLAWLVLVETLSLIFYAASTRYGLPSSETLELASIDARLVWSQFPTAVAPVPGSGPFVVAAAFGIGLVALVGDAFAFRASATVEAVLPAGVFFIFTAAVGTDRQRIVISGAWIAVALVTVAVLRSMRTVSTDSWLGRPGRHAGATLPAAVVCAAWCGLAAALVGPALPGANSEALVDAYRVASDDSMALSPLVDIRSRLVSRSSTEMFLVDAALARYWRATGLSAFDGTTWTQSSSDLISTDGLVFTPGAESQLLLQQITISRLGGTAIPAAHAPVEAVGESSSSGQPIAIAWSPQAEALSTSDGSLRYGDRFTVLSEAFVPSSARLAQATVSNPPSIDLLNLPSGFPTSVVDLAHMITDTSPTPYDKALALQRYFRDNFTYDLAVQSGHSDDAIISFLQIRRGYCEQFAATFAAMGRAVGLPTRVAVGFTPGELRSDGNYHVFGRNAHAWPEVYFDDLGWVLFEPTPGRGAPGSEESTGVAPAQARPGTDNTTGTVAPAPQTTVARPQTTNRPDQNGARPTQTTLAPMLAQGSDSTDGSIGPMGWTLIIGTLLGGWAVMMPGLIRRFTRTGSTPNERVISAWHGAVCALTSAGAPEPAGSSPSEYANRIDHEFAVDPRPVHELARFVTRAIYSPDGVGEPTAMRAAVLHTQVLEATRSTAGWPSRLRRRFDPGMARRLLIGRRPIER